VVERQGLPVAATVASADTGEPQMVQGVLPLFPEETQPEKIAGDKDCDADWLDEARRGWESRWLRRIGRIDGLRIKPRMAGNSKATRGVGLSSGLRVGFRIFGEC